PICRGKERHPSRRGGDRTPLALTSPLDRGAPRRTGDPRRRLSGRTPEWPAHLPPRKRHPGRFRLALHHGDGTEAGHLGGNARLVHDVDHPVDVLVGLGGFLGELLVGCSIYDDTALGQLAAELASVHLLLGGGPAHGAAGAVAGAG